MQGTANHSITRPGAVEKMTGKEGLGALMRSPVSPQMHHIKRFSPLLHVCESKMSPQGESGGGGEGTFLTKGSETLHFLPSAQAVCVVPENN